MGVVIGLVFAVAAISGVVVYTQRGRQSSTLDLPSPQDLGPLREAVVDWTAIKTACLTHDIEQIRTTGAFVPRLPNDLAEQSADASRVLNRLVTGLSPGNVRDALGRMSSRADEIFTEEALNPGIVTERWLVERIAELTGLGRTVEAELQV